MECKICTKAYCQENQPQVLLCGHTLCQICLSTIRALNGTCPFDRTAITISSPNFQLMQLINSQTLPRVFSEHPSSIINRELCPMKHALLLTENRNFHKVRCNLCQGVSRQSSWHCSLCNYDVCHTCKGEILCGFSHLMRKKEKDRFQCDGCLEKCNDESLYCETCDADLCRKCCEKLKKDNFREKLCRKGHEMKWKNNINEIYLMMFNEKYYVCLVCSRRFYKIGSLHCLDCRIDTCITCS